MQRIAAHSGLSAAALALAMLVGVQFGHSPLHHVAEHVAAHASRHAHSGGCHHHHHGGHDHHHHHGHVDEESSQPLGHHDHDAECQLCDLALSPATLSTAATVELSEARILELPPLSQAVLESAELWVAPARGPPAQG